MSFSGSGHAHTTHISNLSSIDTDPLGKLFAAQL
jgi:hypothetical protein